MLTHFESWCRRLLPVALVSVGCLCSASLSVLAQSTPGWQVVETQPPRPSKPRTFQGDEPALQLADPGAMSFHTVTALVSASVVRIDHGQAGKLWQPAATGFLIGTVQGRYLILTNAHVVEDEDNDHKLLETSQLRGIVGGSGAELRVQKIFLHPKREDGHGPDVAISEAKCLDDDAKLRPLTLLPRGHNEPLLGASVAVIGFPNFNGGVKSKPSFSQGSVVQEDAEESALLYDAMTTHGSSGSPVFALTAHQSSRAAGVIVVGVNAATRPIREGGGLFGTTTGALRVAVPVRFAWDIIDEQQLTVGQGEIAFEPSKPNGTTTPLSLQPVNAIQPPLSNPLPLTVKLAEQGKFAEALQLVEVTFASGATHREPLPTALCVAGQLRIERGLQLQQAGDESAARDCFIAAEQHLERAVQADPKLVTATLFLARARANLGRPCMSI